jgi:hypothetical protein
VTAVAGRVTGQAAERLVPGRLAALAEQAVERCRLDLTGRHVLTEAATGAYASTAVLAALAGARVTALARASRHGSVEEVRTWMGGVTAAAGVDDAVDVVERLEPEMLGRADVVTNSGHLRPLDEAFIARLQPGAVVPLMMEAWEIDAGRVDVDPVALRRRGIPFAGTNERHPAVGVFDYLGVMAVKLLLDAGVPVQGCDLVLLCDNAFGPYLLRTLRACGARVTVAADPDAVDLARPVDAVLVSLTPWEGPRLARPHLERLSGSTQHALVAQFFGDVDRAAAADLGIRCWPDPAPPQGHMGVLPSDIGPEPIVRLQAGGLKVGQVLLVPDDERTASEREFLDVLR